MLPNRSVRALIAFSLVLSCQYYLSPIAEAKRRKIGKLTLNSHHCLVPPPPPYVPAWLPDQYRQTALPAKEKPANPYSKYIYTAPGHESAVPVQPNKYVTYWSGT